MSLIPCLHILKERSISRIIFMKRSYMAVRHFLYEVFFDYFNCAVDSRIIFRQIYNSIRQYFSEAFSSFIKENKPIKLNTSNIEIKGINRFLFISQNLLRQNLFRLFYLLPSPYSQTIPSSSIYRLLNDRFSYYADCCMCCALWRSSTTVFGYRMQPLFSYGSLK